MRLFDAAGDTAGPISESFGEDIMSDKAAERRKAFSMSERSRVTAAVGIMGQEASWKDRTRRAKRR
jgi:hypothetical protein